MTASRWFGATCHVTGTAAIQYSRVSPPALPGRACRKTPIPNAMTRAASTIARGPRRRSQFTRRPALAASSRDVDLALHVRPVDPAEERVLPGLRERDRRGVRQGHRPRPDRHRRREEAVAVVRAVVLVAALRLGAVEQERRHLV